MDFKKDVSHVLSKGELDKTLLVISQPNVNAKFQKHRMWLLTPDQQNPNPSEQALAKLNDLKDLVKGNIAFPKLSFTTPPLQLRSSANKISGPGNGENGDVGSYSHTFWLVASIDGVPQPVLDAFGGGTQLFEKQTECIELMHQASMILERKRFDHPEMAIDETAKQQLIKKYQRLNKDITWDQIRDMEFENLITGTERVVRISGNLKPLSNGPQERGITLKSKAWYRPKKEPTKEENDKCITQYQEDAKTYNFTIHPDMIAGLQRGLRHRRVPVFGLNGSGAFTKLPQPLDPLKYPARGGDLLIAHVEYTMYDAMTKGGTWNVTQLDLVHQVTDRQNQQFEAPKQLMALPAAINRHAVLGEKRKREEPMQEETQQEEDGTQD